MKFSEHKLSSFQLRDDRPKSDFQESSLDDSSRQSVAFTQHSNVVWSAKKLSKESLVPCLERRVSNDNYPTGAGAKSKNCG
jgi:hypothetical protein